MIIIRAAVMFSNGEIVEGHSYGHIMTIANKLSLSGDKVYGFIASSGEFVLPVEAAAIAVAAHQIESSDELKPEDLWPVYVLE